LTTLIISYYERFILGHEKITSEASQCTDYQEAEEAEEK
jgi:hypothetical protein